MKKTIPVTSSTIIRRFQCATHLGVSISTIDRMINDGRLPRPIRISARAVGWPLTVIDQFIKNQTIAK